MRQYKSKDSCLTRCKSCLHAAETLFQAINYLYALLLKHALDAVQAFGALRVLSEQMHMQQCSSLAVTDGIRVDVTSAYIGVSILQCASALLIDAS